MAKPNARWNLTNEKKQNKTKNSSSTHSRRRAPRRSRFDVGGCASERHGVKSRNGAADLASSGTCRYLGLKTITAKWITGVLGYEAKSNITALTYACCTCPATSHSCPSQGLIQRFSLGGGAHGERVESEPITGVWGWSPQRGPKLFGS